MSVQVIKEAQVTLFQPELTEGDAQQITFAHVDPPACVLTEIMSSLSDG